MNQVTFTIDGRKVSVSAGTTILEAARRNEIYIPVLCSHPDLPPAAGQKATSVVYQGVRKVENAKPGEAAKGCGLCVVSVEGEEDLVTSCSTEARPGMVVITNNERIQAKRRQNLIPFLARHPHACLTCAQQEGCSRTQCTANVPQDERCCDRFGHCEFQDVVRYIGIAPSTPQWVPTDVPVLQDQPLFTTNYNLCVGCTRCVRACRDVRGIEALGFVFDNQGRVQVGTPALTLNESGCRFCTACVEVCPTGALMDKSVRPGKKEEDLVPCREACPAHIDIPGYLRLIAEGRRDEAHAVIREKVPFPGVLGRVCIHPCEEVCRSGEINEPVAICALKRYAADGEERHTKKGPSSGVESGKKVAVVGAGPAGLTAAFYLRRKGYTVSLFEARKEAGGMLRYGIPPYRLPRDILDREINHILETGIDFRQGKSLGKDFNIDRLKRVGFDGVFLAVGAQLSRRIPIGGSEVPGVLWGVDFLADVAGGKETALKDRVIVIGGGSVAVDSARTALRCGAGDVTMAFLEKREEMVAREWEVEQALGEGVRLIPSWGLQKILSKDGQITGAELVRCSRVLDDQGNFSPVFDNIKKSIEGDQVIVATGQASDLSFIEGDRRIPVDNGLIVVDPDTLETGMEGVYAGGDVTRVPGSVVHAIAAGRRAASSIDRALGGDGRIDEVLFDRRNPDPHLGREERFAGKLREKVPEQDAEERVTGFEEVVLAYDDDQAVREAKRCFQCDLRLFMACNPPPPKNFLGFNRETIRQVPEAGGVFRLYDGEQRCVCIKGTPNIRQDLMKMLKSGFSAARFDFEEERMYSRRESELVQRYLREYGKMPRSGDLDLDDLF